MSTIFDARSSHQPPFPRTRPRSSIPTSGRKAFPLDLLRQLAHYRYQDSPLERTAYDLRLEFGNGIDRRSFYLRYRARHMAGRPACRQAIGRYLADNAKSLARPFLDPYLTEARCISCASAYRHL